jgi:hypothetical protein
MAVSRYSVREVDLAFSLQPIAQTAFVPGAPSFIDLSCSPGDAIET